MAVYVAAVQKGNRIRTKEFTANNEVEARRAAGCYWHIRVGHQLGIKVSEKGELL